MECHGRHTYVPALGPIFKGHYVLICWNLASFSDSSRLAGIGIEWLLNIEHVLW